MSHATSQIAGVILAGGQSSRLGPGSKAMIQLGDQPMIHHVIARLKSQVSPLLVSTQDAESEIDTLGLDIVEDAVKRHRGPLTGLYSAMRNVFESSDLEWMLLTPCDAPFIPLNLAELLFSEAITSEKPVSVACYELVPQPTFSLWHRSVFPHVKSVVTTEGKGGLMYMLDRLPYCTTEWPNARVAPFFNVNTRADLQMAERLLDSDTAAD
ncbi:MAG: molybdopterin-guanine dinucleotide biosynthesis protein A [Lysobacterales bacterium]|jgi:molybdopterin-guanine dinucleotide biosynthesis protein A